MKHWVVLTVLLYALALLALTEPSLLIAFAGKNSLTAKRAAEVYLDWGFWLWIGILITAQALLLQLPLKISERKFIPRTTLKIPCTVTAFLLAVLFFAGIVDVLCALFREQGMKVFSYLIPFNLDFAHPKTIEILVAATITLLAFWVVWTILFRHYADSDDPASLLKRTVRWLLVAGTLEMLIAAPCHIILGRDNNLAPAGTFWGMANSVAILLIAGSPALFLLIARPKPKLPTTAVEK